MLKIYQQIYSQMDRWTNWFENKKNDGQMDGEIRKQMDEDRKKQEK